MKWFGMTYSILVVSTFFLFVAVGVGGLLQAHTEVMSTPAMRQLTKGMPSSVVEDILLLEMPNSYKHRTQSAVSEEQLILTLFRYFTQMDPSEPWSIVSSELPGRISIASLNIQDNQQGGTHQLDDIEQPDQSSDSQVTDSHNHPNLSQPDPLIPPDQTEQPDQLDPIEDTPTTIEQPTKVFIYHSHNRESWVPELEGVTKRNEAFDADINITLLGDRLAENLKEHGIGALSSNQDYYTTIDDYNWNFSYAYSLETVQEAFAANPELEYYFDLHRDSQGKDITTVTIDGQTYARVYFVIGRKNPDWEKNEALATQMHDLLEASYPGISRGILGKTSNSGHAEYNQSFSANSILIEIGGVENTLQESYRTIDILGGIIADIFWEAEKEQVLNKAERTIAE